MVRILVANVEEARTKKLKLETLHPVFTLIFFATLQSLKITVEVRHHNT